MKKTGPTLPAEMILEIVKFFAAPLDKFYNNGEFASLRAPDVSAETDILGLNGQGIRRDLANFCLVSHSFRQAAIPHLFRIVEFHFGCEVFPNNPAPDGEDASSCSCHSIADFSQFLVEHPELAARVQELRICGGGCRVWQDSGARPPLPRIKVSALAGAITYLPKLRVLNLVDIAYELEPDLAAVRAQLQPLALDRLILAQDRDSADTPFAAIAPVFAMIGASNRLDLLHLRSIMPPEALSPPSNIPVFPTRVTLDNSDSISSFLWMKESFLVDDSQVDDLALTCTALSRLFDLEMLRMMIHDGPAANLKTLAINFKDVGTGEYWSILHSESSAYHRGYCR